ncbi:beta-ketoacyl synthase chain length factor [Brachyspira alvinipulli]|uniref:beta-ketoacyl synthase chain length factor n=1 Tax=Brachyspira alvinipulli TaxID=84379 RepID=UPI0004856048|nr:beta-ketoacyl synthase chain length factor [Brachyspira alvinipulli]
MSDLSFRVLDWDFFAPNIDKKFILDNLNENINISYGETNPDLDFIPRAQKRRLSQITKLSFESVKNILKENDQIPIFFVSKYGEIKQQYNISKKIVTEHEVSPALFSFSVFNTAVAQLTIFYQSHERAIAVTCYDNFIDTALLQATSFLKTSEHNKALIIIADEKLPESYEIISNDNNYSFACSFLVSIDDADIDINVIDSDIKKDENSIIDFIKFISTDTPNLKLGKIELTKK